MALGLTPRCEGNDRQHIIYDDLREPVFNVAGGEISSSYLWNLKRDVRWQMTNEYLRRYLWMRGARGVRVFFYEALVAEIPELRELMNGQAHVIIKPKEGIAWYELDIREHASGLLLQVWAAVEAVTSELCPQQTAEGILWPGADKPMTRRLADNIVHHHATVYLDDSFLQRYEQNAFYDCIPIQIGEYWHCDPSYKGQWSFTECRRIGRNLIQVPMRELYKSKPEREIMHAFKFAIDPTNISNIDLTEEHIVGKTQRLLDVLLRLGDCLSSFGRAVGLDKSPTDWIRYDRAKLAEDGWLAYPVLGRLAQVAPLNMSQQDFLARCKTLHEIITSVPDGHLKSLLGHAGCGKKALGDRRSLKLLETLFNIITPLNDQCETVSSFMSETEPEGWQERNERLAALFLNSDLRNADAHESMQRCFETLQGMGFDTVSLNSGYGRALDFVMDSVIETLKTITEQIEKLLAAS